MQGIQCCSRQQRTERPEVIEELRSSRVVAALELEFGIVVQGINLVWPDLIFILQQLQIVSFVVLELLDGRLIAQKGHNRFCLCLP